MSNLTLPQGSAAKKNNKQTVKSIESEASPVNTIHIK